VIIGLATHGKKANQTRVSGRYGSQGSPWT